MKPEMAALVARYAAMSPLELATAEAQQAALVYENQRRLSLAQQHLAAIAKARKIINRKQKGSCHGR